MLCSRGSLLTRSRHILHCRATIRTQTGQLQAPEVIFEHAQLLAINKPPGVPFHSTDHVLGVVPTLRCMEAEGLLPYLGPLYPLHRLRQPLLSISSSGPTASCMHAYMQCLCSHYIFMEVTAHPKCNQD